jgi:hypothetical protein
MEHKHLGVIFSENDKWTSHITSNVNKALQIIAILRSLIFFISRAGWDRLYVAFIRRLLKYADVMWNNCSNELKMILNQVSMKQKESLSFVTSTKN